MSVVSVSLYELHHTLFDHRPARASRAAFSKASRLATLVGTKLIGEQGGPRTALRAVPENF
jgi:hypothetical protein